MSGPGRFWVWLSDDRNRNVLGFLGAGIAAVAVAAWQVYLHLSPTPAQHTTPPAAVAATARTTAPAANVDAAALERLQSSQQRALRAETSALDKVTQQIDAVGNPPAPASSAKH